MSQVKFVRLIDSIIKNLFLKLLSYVFVVVAHHHRRCRHIYHTWAREEYVKKFHYKPEIFVYIKKKNKKKSVN